ncbi:FemAB family PEP-CTERM system-associated protein [Skermanella sp. TT6]|uniref:FemAB family PEP-CTERM system-associated protein n=1 Tax=Skermanella cutis TaxID=2775420 RepID=A0ABX7B4Z8_9PROT|nr:FemAB family XrtA/PEP-CTERM system-associated protein [Skermanella sp. TT6]QQP88710.1 FemAB family PEP-CTERM system-associated protein [Skermanella sp. TT6]
MTAMVEVGTLDAATEPAWEAFVAESPEATFFHRAGWARVIGRSYGHPTYFRYASRGGRIVGVLPLVHVKSPLFGNALIATGFCTFGGIASSDPGAIQALARDAAELGARLGVDHVELRHVDALPIGWTVKSELYAAFRRPLDADIGVTWGTLPQQKRQELRRSIRGGLRQQVGPGLLDAFYRIYGTSVRNLGTPVYPRRFFAAIAEEFGEAVELAVVHGASGPVSAVMAFHFRDTVCPYFAGGLPEARTEHAYDFMYWSLMDRATERGARLFDFGRSKRGTGAFDYKLGWGFEPRALHYQFHLVRGRELPEVNPLNPKYRAMVETWKRLPLPVANLMGPVIARQIG